MAKKSLSTGFTGNVTPETGVAAKARSAVNRARDEAGMVAAHAVDHPTATASAVVMVGLLGLGVGYLLGLSSASRPRRGYY